MSSGAKKHIKKGMKLAAFVVVFCMLLSWIQGVLVNPEPGCGQRLYSWIYGFWSEPRDSLDAVLIGNSSAYTSWCAPIAYDRYGIRVYPFTSPSQPLSLAREMIEMARTRQKNALYIIPLNGMDSETTMKNLHRAYDYLPFQFKLHSVSNCPVPWTSKTELLFPLIQFHSRWSALQTEDFHHRIGEYKGACFGEAYLSIELSEDASAYFRATDERGNIPSASEKALIELLDYLDENGIEALFCIFPQCREDSWPAQYNTAKDIVESRGYRVLDLSLLRYELQLDPTTDYYNLLHTNVHGALKITDFFANYLVENYRFAGSSGGGVRELG